MKFFDGCWYSVLIAQMIFTTIAVWRKGIARLIKLVTQGRARLEAFFHRIKAAPPVHFPDIAVYLTALLEYIPQLLLKEMRHAPVLHEQIILVTVKIEGMPHVPGGERAKITDLMQGFHRVSLRDGFMQNPNLLVALRFCEMLRLAIDPETSTFDVSGIRFWQRPATR